MPIKNFKDYEISNYGRVYSHTTNKMLKHDITTNGYYHVILYKDGKRYNKKPHRLVAEAFLPNPNNLPCVNHKNEIKTDNHVELMLDENGNVVVDYEKSNLEWCTYKYNTNYGTGIERMSAKQKGISRPYVIERNKRLCSKPVVAVDNDDNVAYEFASTREAQRNGFNSGNISACCRNCYYGSNYYKGLFWYWKKDWLEMQKNKATPHKRELPYQLSLQFD